MDFIKKLFKDRYGIDQLSLFILSLFMVIYVVLNVISAFLDMKWLLLFAIIPIIIFVLRIFSKKIQKRRIENEKFLKFWNPIQSHWLFVIEKFKNRKKYKYLKCPSCKAKLRVPRLGGKKISVKCNKCNSEFTTKA